MGPLFAEWSDKDTIGALGTLVVGLIGAVAMLIRTARRSYADVYALKKKVDSEREEKQADREDHRTEHAFNEMKAVLKLVNEEVAVLKRKDAKRDQIEAKLVEDVMACKAERATLTEQNRWMRRILKKNGLISDSDEHDYPKSPSEEIELHGPKKETHDERRNRSIGRVRGGAEDPRDDSPNPSDDGGSGLGDGGDGPVPGE